MNFEYELEQCILEHFENGKREFAIFPMGFASKKSKVF